MNHFHLAEPDKSAALQKKSPGKNAVLMLANVADKNCFIIWSDKDFYGKRARFFSVQELKEIDVIDNTQQIRSSSMIQALINREFIQPVYDGTSIPKINKACEEKGELPFQMPSPFVRRSTSTNQAPPWSISDDIFQITDLGQTFLAANTNRIALYRREIEKQKTFVSSVSTNSRGENLVGLGGIYKVIKETSKRFYVEPIEDALPNLTYDHSLKAHENGDGIDLRFIRKGNILVQNMNADDIERLQEINQDLIETKQRLNAEFNINQTDDPNYLEAFRNEYSEKRRIAEELFSKRVAELVKNQAAFIPEDGFILEICEEEVSPLRM